MDNFQVNKKVAAVAAKSILPEIFIYTRSGTMYFAATAATSFSDFPLFLF